MRWFICMWMMYGGFYDDKCTLNANTVNARRFIFRHIRAHGANVFTKVKRCVLKRPKPKINNIIISDMLANATNLIYGYVISNMYFAYMWRDRCENNAIEHGKIHLFQSVKLAKMSLFRNPLTSVSWCKCIYSHQSITPSIIMHYADNFFSFPLILSWIPWQKLSKFTEKLQTVYV